jgi:hypothetical protein
MIKSGGVLFFRHFKYARFLLFEIVSKFETFLESYAFYSTGIFTSDYLPM